MREREREREREEEIFLFMDQHGKVTSLAYSFLSVVRGLQVNLARVLNHIWKGNTEREIRRDIHFRVFLPVSGFLFFFQADRGYTKGLFSHKEAFFMRVRGSVCCFCYPCRSDVVPLYCRGGSKMLHILYSEETCTIGNKNVPKAWVQFMFMHR